MAGPATCLLMEAGAHSFSVRSTEGVFRAFWPLTLWDCYSICLKASDRRGKNGLCLSKSKSLKWGEVWLWDPVRLLRDDDRRHVIVSWWVEFWSLNTLSSPLSHWIVNTLLISILASTATAGHTWDLRARVVLRQDLFLLLKQWWVCFNMRNYCSGIL